MKDLKLYRIKKIEYLKGVLDGMGRFINRDSPRWSYEEHDKIATKINFYENASDQDLINDIKAEKDAEERMKEFAKV